ncbi:LINE-1 retrotransposable element ORF2 protein [Ananas comosus]|uniref:LINE-1 retrotransposable element ORF2 protein n=1 Tax=Ananas comosus TaxID=4615 RepID=A0A199W1B4_ANACO|nr:LINE-1 retrotransposable element ORF2 protein [Ananas comosus]
MPSNSAEILLFREAINDTGLADLPLRNRAYTWSNGRRNPTLERLDRALVSLDWLRLFPSSSLKALPRQRSDHCPLILTASTFVPHSGLFRFEASWLRCPSFGQMVTDAWNYIPPSSEPVTRLSEKLRKVRQVLSSWSFGRTSLLRKQADSCLRWIGWLDSAKEGRQLSHLEFALRLQLKGRYDELCLQDEIYWKQRSKVHWLKEGDANTKFFHIRATIRRNKNFISQLSNDTNSLTSPAAIADHLLSFYSSQLGVELYTSRSIHSLSLYGPDSLDLSSLSHPFAMDEVKTSIFSCAPDKAPGPDGFPLMFFQRFWHTLKDDIFDVFSSFYDGPLDLSDINKSWICPIPKKATVETARDLRPISLIHSVPKIISKVLATRLQLVMDKLVNPFQTTFIKGRHILDNFYSAHILIHHLHSSKHKAALLKIDFERAFDQINWDFLFQLLSARGFGTKWIDWIKGLLLSTSSAVLLNGTPGSSFVCKRGLRQGDPLSPLLFILCIDVLFRMIDAATSSGHLPTVGIGEVSIHTLQFADDILIFFDGSRKSAAVIKVILDAFSDSSGLKINFNNSALIPLHLSDDQKIDARLAGWKGATLSRGARFHCLAKWEHICRPKKAGGIGIRDLRAANTAQLLKGLWNFYYSRNLPWVKLLRQKHYIYNAADQISIPTGSCPIWKGMLKIAAPFPISVDFSLGDGMITPFWTVRWCGNNALRHRFPILYAATTLDAAIRDTTELWFWHAHLCSRRMYWQGAVGLDLLFWHSGSDSTNNRFSSGKDIDGDKQKAFRPRLRCDMSQLWKERNRRIFDDRFEDCGKLGQRICETAMLWELALTS